VCFFWRRESILRWRAKIAPGNDQESKSRRRSRRGIYGYNRTKCTDKMEKWKLLHMPAVKKLNGQWSMKTICPFKAGTLPLIVVPDLNHPSGQRKGRSLLFCDRKPARITNRPLISYSSLVFSGDALFIYREGIPGAVLLFQSAAIHAGKTPRGHFPSPVHHIIVPGI
jgi:hypothetical protein